MKSIRLKYIEEILHNLGQKLSKGCWLSIVEYASFRNISITGARCFVKSGRVKTDVRGGKHYIFVNDDDFKAYSKDREKKYMAIKLELDNLRKEILELNIKNKELQNTIQNLNMQNKDSELRV